MTFALTGWMLYTMLVVLGVMWLDFLISFVRSLIRGSVNLTLVLDYLKDMIFYILPLFLLVSLIPLDPVGWIFSVFFAIGSLGVFLHYLKHIGQSFK